MSCISSSPHPWGLVGRACSGPEAPPKPEAQWGCGGDSHSFQQPHRVPTLGSVQHPLLKSHLGEGEPVTGPLVLKGPADSWGNERGLQQRAVPVSGGIYTEAPQSWSRGGRGSLGFSTD